ncbi:MAG: DUF2797 domain-containing protein [Thermoplasmata archaeon]|nr:DUF2797 domain-containing protein [Thermoplasmata archaeon]
MFPCGWWSVFNQALDVFNLRSHGTGHPDRHVVRATPCPEPEVLVFDHRSGSLTGLDLDPVSFTLSHDAMCVGRFEGPDYAPCPHRQRTGAYGMCAECGASLIRHQECIFEPRCEGEVCGEGICTAEHVVYIAYFGPSPKVGMSTASRVDTRVLEQGADAFSILATVPNRYRARRLERTVAETLDVRQGFRSEVLLAMLVEDVDRGSVERAHASLTDRLVTTFGVAPSPLRWIGCALPRLDAVPELVEAPGRHEGGYVGVRGRVLVYDDGALRALKLRDMEGRFLLDVLQ